MPQALEPGRKVRIVLDVDRGKDPEPCFFVKSLSVRQTRDIAEAYDELCQRDETTWGEFEDATIGILGEQIVGWEHMGEFGDYQPEKLADVLNVAEVKELLGGILNAVSHEDKKKSE